MMKILLDRNNTMRFAFPKQWILFHIGMESILIYFGDEENAIRKIITMTKLLQKK